jgi:hypothetical protein
MSETAKLLKHISAPSSSTTVSIVKTQTLHKKHFYHFNTLTIIEISNSINTYKAAMYLVTCRLFF